MKRQKVSSIVELQHLEELVKASATETTRKLRHLLQEEDGLGFLAMLKFTQAGHDPLDAGRALNLIEQLNQTFTYLASMAATRWLIDKHPDHVPFILNLGTRSGMDIESEDEAVAAETFAATHPDSNQKLQKDIAKVAASRATFKYVFFISPAGNRDDDHGDVTVVHLRHDAVNSSPNRHPRSHHPVPAKPRGRTTEVGYLNRNNQSVLRPTGRPGNDHMQYVYVLECGDCGHEYGANGSDIFQRKCPKCQGGMPGLEY